jgi:hypothetical protein
VIDETVKGFGGKFGERWLEGLFTPAFVFWLGGGLAWAYAHDWTSAANAFEALPQVEQAVIAVLAFLAVSASAVIVETLTLPIVRLLEGYGPLWPAALSEAMKRRQRDAAAAMRAALTPLADKGIEALSDSERTRFNDLDRKLHYVPVDGTLMMPTHLGNILRSAETRPYVRYGLDGVKCWPQLWSVLSDGTRADLGVARADLDADARSLLWSALFLAWTVWSVWALPIGLAGVMLCHARLVHHAESYADLIAAAYDTGRAQLYAALRLPLPKNAAEERALGSKLTEHLWRGSDEAAVVFEQTAKNDGAH